MSERIRFILSKDELIRIHIDDNDGNHVIYIDLHGLSVKRARQLLKNIISLDRERYDICVIHGYNHGTALKEMIMDNSFDSRICKKTGVKGNYGRTVLSLAA